MSSHTFAVVAARLVGLGILFALTGCGQSDGDSSVGTQAAAPAEEVPESLSMGGERSVMSFFVTSRGVGNGGDLGGLVGADAHCQALADAEYAGDREWRAYLSTTATEDQPAVNARDRIGQGPWYNGEATLIATDLDELHSERSRINKELAVTERLDVIAGAGDSPNRHDILTGSEPDGTAFEGGEDSTCGNWTSSSTGSAQVGHHDRKGRGEGVNSWNSEHPTRGCSQEDFAATGGDGLFYCFAAD